MFLGPFYFTPGWTEEEHRLPFSGSVFVFSVWTWCHFIEFSVLEKVLETRSGKTQMWSLLFCWLSRHHLIFEFVFKQKCINLYHSFAFDTIVYLCFFHKFRLWKSHFHSLKIPKFYIFIFVKRTKGNTIEVLFPYINVFSAHFQSKTFLLCKSYF